MKWPTLIQSQRHSRYEKKKNLCILNLPTDCSELSSTGNTSYTACYLVGILRVCFDFAFYGASVYRMWCVCDLAIPDTLLVLWRGLQQSPWKQSSPALFLKDGSRKKKCARFPSQLGFSQHFAGTFERWWSGERVDKYVLHKRYLPQPWLFLLFGLPCEILVSLPFSSTPLGSLITANLYKVRSFTLWGGILLCGIKHGD